jgi:hypothetical protein
MTKRFLILLFIFFVIIQNGIAQETAQDAKLRSIVKELGQAEVITPLSDRNQADLLSSKLSVLGVRNKTLSISISPLTIDWFLQQNLEYDIVERDESKGAITASSVAEAKGWEKYPTYTQYDSIMQSFVALYPALCHLDTIGRSINGKLVLALKISDNASVEEDEPEVFYSSSIHGDETGGYILMLHLADYLLKNYSTDTRVKNIVDNMQVFINPLSNPDGTYYSGNTIVTPSRYNANGKDLNRNFPDPLQPYEVQQKENIDMMSFMRKHRFVMSANFHSGAEVVNYPWDRWSRLHADDIWFNSISRAYADTVHKHAPAGYMTDEVNGVTNGFAWYQVKGGRQDYMTWELQGREVTIEIDGTDYVTPTWKLATLWEANYRSLLGFIENSLYGIHGIVKNSITSEPVLAKVFISGHDKDSSIVFSSVSTGSFIRLIAPGTWRLTFRAAGYYDQVVSNVIVVDGQSTNITVDMVPAVNVIDTTYPDVPVLYPNPSSTSLKAVLPEKLFGYVIVRLYDARGVLLMDYHDEAVHGTPLVINVDRLPSGAYTVTFTSIATKATSSSRIIVNR